MSSSNLVSGVQWNSVRAFLSKEYFYCQPSGILNDFDSHKSGVFLVPDNNTWAPQLRARINCNVIKLEKNVALMQCGYDLAVHEI